MQLNLSAADGAENPRNHDDVFPVFTTTLRLRRQTPYTLCSVTRRPVYEISYDYLTIKSKGKASPYSITKRWVPELIPVLCSRPAGDVSHKPGGRLPLLSASHTLTR